MAYTERQKTSNELLTRKGEEQVCNFSEIVSTELSLIGAPTHLKGYKYIKQALIFINEDSTLRFSALCKKLSSYYDQPISAIISALDNFVNVLIAHTDFEISSYFGYSINYKISRAKLTAMLYDRIMLKYVKKGEEQAKFIKVTNHLRKLCIPPNLTGYHYLRQALVFIMEEPKLLFCMLKELFPKILNQFDISYVQLERSIRTSIKVAFSCADSDVLHSYFGCTISPSKTKTTNTQFIRAVYEKIMLDDNKNVYYIKISNLLNKLGIPSSIRGFHYLRAYLLFALEHQDQVNIFSQKCISNIATYYNVTTLSVVSAIRHAIEFSCSRANSEINRFLGKNYKEFVAHLYNEIISAY